MSKEYPLHGRVRSVHELEHEVELLRKRCDKFQSKVMVDHVIILDLQKEVEDRKKEITSLKRKLARANRRKSTT